jgi:hypothetical protein
LNRDPHEGFDPHDAEKLNRANRGWEIQRTVLKIEHKPIDTRAGQGFDDD